MTSESNEIKDSGVECYGNRRHSYSIEPSVLTQVGYMLSRYGNQG